MILSEKLSKIDCALINALKYNLKTNPIDIKEYNLDYLKQYLDLQLYDNRNKIKLPRQATPATPSESKGNYSLLERRIRQGEVWQKTAGFGLLELIIAIVILSIIIAIAVPSYLSYINNEKLRYAKTRLNVMALAIEAKHAEKGTYKNIKLSDIDFSATDEEGNTYVLSDLSDNNFLLSATLPDNDTCHTLSVNAVNQRQAFSAENEDTKLDCW